VFYGSVAANVPDITTIQNDSNIGDLKPDEYKAALDKIEKARMD